MENTKFEDLLLSEEIKRGIKDMGFEEMSPIQSQAIPLLLDGKDIMGQAQTGTGKTAAFGLPILEMVDASDNSTQALILCPTRELSIQVAGEISNLGKHVRGLQVVPIYGGQPIDRQFKALKKGVQIVVGTPGRVIDHIKRKTLKTDNIRIIVLDEADEMFNMGFREDMELVMGTLPEERQTIFFSATMDKQIRDFSKHFQKEDAQLVKVVQKELTVPNVEQIYFELKENMKPEILSRLIDIKDPKLTVVFCNTKRKVDDLTSELQSRGYSADGLHGDLKQSQRDNVMNKFRRGTIDILVATDVAARGIDVDEVDLVVNYDMPQDDEYYVHRIGRTARAGRKGTAVSFVSGRDIYKLKDIQKYTKTKLDRAELPTLKDIEERYTSNILDTIKEEVNNGELSKYVTVIDLLLQEELTSLDIAAALLKLYMSENKLDGHKELDTVDFGKQFKSNQGYESSSRNNSRSDNRSDNRSDSRSDNRSSHRSSKGMTRLFVNAGNKKGVSARHILSALIQETNIEKRSIGNIDVYDKFTFVEVPNDLAKDIVRDLNEKRILGMKINVEVANPKI